jgi:hypothetical protein
MPKRSLGVVAMLLAAASAISGQPASDIAPVVREISARVLAGDSVELLRQLTDDIGARLVGSPAYERAVQSPFRDRSARSDSSTGQIVRPESMELSCGSDDCPFVLEGIPALKLWVDTAQYREIHHKASDTFDKVDAMFFRRGGAVAAATTYMIAEQGAFATRIEREAVGRLLREAGLDADLMFALWKP